ncbi:unnamed protein product, partial [Discosporangium mesarthrocarpum]
QPIKKKKTNCYKKSTLVVEGASIRIEDLDLDGALVIRVGPRARLAVQGLRVKNRGWGLKPLE